MKFKVLLFLLCVAGGTVLSSAAMAAIEQPLPGPADVSRIKPEERIATPDRTQDQQVTVPAFVATTPVPEGVKSIHLTLKSVTIVGMTAFTPDEMADVYASYIDKDVTLDVAWVIAGAITQRYQNAGYFLSRAYVPQQRIKDGGITINVIEGYVGKVEVGGDVGQHRVVQEYIDRLQKQRPVKTDTIESFLLRMNDLPGYSFRSVLSPLDEKGADEAAIKLVLIAADKAGKGSISYDNFSSRYMGPDEAFASYTISFLPLQQTTFSALSSLPPDRLRYGVLKQDIAIAADITLELNAGLTKAYPGYKLDALDIASQTTSGSIGLNYQWIRQRDQNLLLKILLDSRNIFSNILYTPQTREQVRAFRAGIVYDTSDKWHGYDNATLTLSHGIDGLGSSTKDNFHPSRPDVSPNFVKAELDVSRLQGITNDWSLFGAATGQLSNGKLYSSEQFGYGGQSFGRAYDTSEVTGDEGLEGSLELRYGGFSEWQPVTPQPYAFYDIGTVWNDGTGALKRTTGASAGFGMRFNTIWHQSGNLGVAFPLTRDIATPIYVRGEVRGPRILLQITQDF